MSEKNDFMPAQTNWVYYTTRWIARLICRVYFRIEVQGKENVPSEGPVILAANHASFLDPPLTAVALKRPMHFVARKTLWGKNRFWDKFLYGCNAFPVDQDKPDVASFKVMLRFLQAGEGVVLYPEGSRSWDGSLQEPKTGVAGCSGLYPGCIPGVAERSQDAQAP
jgi:1-acyl-sn-glycerol-3-phosphate acyltransferase